ncbi:hypothetical protein V1523DRAFT_414907 [Lipomyces doorenjongii]
MFQIYDESFDNTDAMTGNIAAGALADDSVNVAYRIGAGHSDVSIVLPESPSTFFTAMQPYSTYLRPHSYSEPSYLSRYKPAAESDYSEVSEDEFGHTPYMSYSDYEQDLSVQLEPPTTTSQLRRSHSMYIARAAQPMYSPTPVSVSPTFSQTSLDGQDIVAETSDESQSVNVADVGQGIAWNINVPFEQLFVSQALASPQLGMMDYPFIIPNQAFSATQIDQQSSLMPTTFGNQRQPSLPGTAVPPFTAAQVSHPVTIISTTPYPSTTTVPSHSSSAGADRTRQGAASMTTRPRRNQDIDRNGRRRRVYTKTQFTCSHCPRKFSITNIEVYCRHVVENNIQREFKCHEPTCPWHIIGFQRKLERDRHYTRKHGVPQYECRFWAGPGKEIFKGAGVCTTRWHADAGNRTRHERNVHGYYIATQRGHLSSLDEAEMVKVDKVVRR